MIKKLEYAFHFEKSKQEYTKILKNVKKIGYKAFIKYQQIPKKVQAKFYRKLKKQPFYILLRLFF